MRAGAGEKEARDPLQGEKKAEAPTILRQQERRLHPYR